MPRTVATCRMVGVDAIGVGDDETAKNATWRSYERRELIANIKMIVDVVMKTDVGTLIYDPAADEFGPASLGPADEDDSGPSVKR